MLKYLFLPFLLFAQEPLLPKLNILLQEQYPFLKAQDSNIYYLAYRLHDSTHWDIRSTSGRTLLAKAQNTLSLSTELRFGSAKLDHTRPLQENFNPEETLFPREHIHPQATLQELRRKSQIQCEWLFRKARKKWKQLETNFTLHPNKLRQGFDLSPSNPSQLQQTSPKMPLDTLQWKEWQKQLQNLSSLTKPHHWILESEFHLSLSQTDKYLLDSEGSKQAYSENLFFLDISIRTRSKDGDIIQQFHKETFALPPSQINSPKLIAQTQQLISKLDQLRKAPILEPFAGPVILKGQAAAVYVHEVLGHRMESHRFKTAEDGRTFLKKEGQAVAPSWIDIYDDPTIKTFQKMPLNGHYKIDDQGIASQKTHLMKSGKIQGFLHSRSTPRKQDLSNGHGRSNLGKVSVARMGNTILEARQTVSYPQLRQKMILLLKKRNLPFGLVLHDLSGGYTFTDQTMPQTFKLTPYYITKVFANGNPDEVVRGVDASGTPLVSLQHIVAAADDPTIFNGFCGAESGWVPVSARSPSLLFDNMEFETQHQEKHLPPILSLPQ